MIELVDGMTLYHGSYTEVSHIDLSRCTKGKDFGQGFYVTSSYEQACRFVALSNKRAQHSGLIPVGMSGGAVSSFRYHEQDGLRICVFEEANAEWLHLVASNRDSRLFPREREISEQQDIIGGKIANDRTAQTLQFYLAGAFGTPGEMDTDEITIRTLLPNRLKDQFCFKTERAVAVLEFLGSERVE